MLYNGLKCRSIGALFLRPYHNGRVLTNVADKLESFHSSACSEGDVVSRRVPFANPLAIKIAHALQLGERSKASDLLSDVSSGHRELCVDDLTYILAHCAKKPDPMFLMQTWKILEERNLVSDKCYLLIINSLCNAGYLEEAFALVKRIGDELRTNFLLPLYNTLLSACIKMQDVKRAYQCLDLMDSQMVGKNEVTYIALLKLAVWKKNLSAVHEIWKEYSKYYNMNIISLRKFVKAFASLNDLQYAYKATQQMLALVLKGEAFLSKNAEGKFHCQQLDIPIRSENGNSPFNNEYPIPSISVNDVEMSSGTIYSQHCTLNDAEILESKSAGLSMLEEHTRAPIMKFLRWSFNDLLQACARSKNFRLAEQLILLMKNLGLEPTSHTFDGFLRAVLLERGCSSGIETVKLMQERNLKPYDSTLTFLSVGCSRELDLDMAELLLSETSECKKAHPYNAFLAACEKMNQPERAVRILAKMKERKVKPDIQTYEILFLLFANINPPYEEGNILSQVDAARRIKAIEMDMVDNGIQHSQKSLFNLLKALGAEGMIKELMQYLRLAEQQLPIQDAPLGIEIYNNVLHCLVEARQSHMAIEIFKSMKMCGLNLNSATYTIMINCCSYIRCIKSATALVSMMIRNGFWPQNVTYTVLIKILLDFDDFEGALNLLHQTITDGIQPDVLMFNTILSRAYAKERIDVIELIVEQMHEQRVQPDPTTCHYVFNSYAEGELFTTALEALEVLSLRMISEDETVLQETKARFEEDLILAEDPKAEVRILNLLGSCTDEVCFALLNLRWCALMGSELSWEPNQSPWARRISSAYKGYNTMKEEANLSHFPCIPD